MVELDSNEFIPMSQLKVGDRVRVSADAFSPVYTFSHQDAKITYDFVRLTTTEGSLRLTATHLIYLNSTKLVAAGLVSLGDLLTTSIGSLASVVAIAHESGVGLYNPHTVDGSIIVVSQAN